ncbi:MAG: MerR family transcriptional regulator [Actinomycetota bacterium]|nr:MerR family transcriptional regulator [Actinomycetota bacterium]
MAQRHIRAVESEPDAGGRASATDGADLTIEQLAQETGMTVRNIRAHQSRGLLPPPEVRARTGYYGAEHVARLRLIGEMQADGFNLGAIKRLLEGAQGAEQVLGLKRAISAPFETEAPEVLTEEELNARFGAQDEPKLRAKAVRLGLVRPLGSGRFEVPSSGATTCFGRRSGCSSSRYPSSTRERASKQSRPSAPGSRASTPWRASPLWSTTACLGGSRPRGAALAS